MKPWFSRSASPTPVLICAAMLSLALQAQAADPADTDVAPAERAEAIEAAVAKLNAEYIDPGLARKMGHAIRTRAKKNEYAGIARGQDFADKLTADLREISHDKHLWVGYHAEGARDEPMDGPSNEELDKWRDAVARDNFSFDKVERMEGNIGYLKFRIFAYPYLAAETATAAMSFIAHTDALIIDLRQNMGGEPAMVAYMLSYLFDERTHLNDIYIRNGGKLQQYWTVPHVPGQVFGGKKPVFVLTSHDTFSGAEDFAYALKNLKRARIVGETTGGGAHPSRAFKVTEHFSISIPYARSISPITLTDWEGTGVLPDISVPATDALDAAYKAALESLAGSTTDAGRKQELQRLLEEKQ